jgi:hypothetical protein
MVRVTSLTVFLNSKLYFISGVTSNTDAAQLAETFAVAKCPTKVYYRSFLEYLITIATLYFSNNLLIMVVEFYRWLVFP